MHVHVQGNPNPPRKCGGCGAVVTLERDDVVCIYIFGVNLHSFTLPPPPAYGYNCPGCNRFREQTLFPPGWTEHAFNKAQQKYLDNEKQEQLAKVERSFWHRLFGGAVK